MRFRFSALGLVLLGSAAAAVAQDTTPSVRLSGFGTVGMVVTDTDDADYQTGVQAGGATTKPSASPDTRFGFQTDIRLNNTFSATGQWLMRQNAKGSYEPGTEWAFLKANLTDSWAVRVGRMGGPFFATSDFRTVGYTNLSVRNPAEVYGLVQFRSFDGADVLYKGSMGGASINAQLYVGESSILANNTPSGELYFQLKESVGLSASAEIDSFTLRAGYTVGKLETDGPGAAPIETLFRTLNSLGSSVLTSYSNAASIEGKTASFAGVGLVFDNGDWIVNSEYVVRDTDSLYVSDNDAWYLTAGKRFGKWTPYVSYAKRTTTSTTTFAAPSTTGLPPQVAGQSNALVAALDNAVNDSSVSSLAFGTRWDLGKSYALKAEYAQVMVPAGSNAFFRPNKPGAFASDTTVNVFSVLVDFVF